MVMEKIDPGFEKDCDPNFFSELQRLVNYILDEECFYDLGFGESH
jgi:hypothetical protein